MTKLCPHCGQDLKMRSFALLNDYCPNCGKRRHSIRTQTIAKTFMAFAYSLVPFLMATIYFGFSGYVYLLWLPAVFLILRFYKPRFDDGECK